MKVGDLVRVRFLNFGILVGLIAELYNGAGYLEVGILSEEGTVDWFCHDEVEVISESR